MINYKQIIIIVGLIFSASTAYGLQSKTANDNQTLLFKISSSDFNKIFITDDHIVSVKGRNDSYELKQFNNINDQGVVFIKPSYAYQGQAFSIFVDTEQGHSYTLFLTPLNIPSESIQITPISAAKHVAIKWETNSPYSQQIIKLMQDMVNDERPEGYAVVDLGKTKPKRLSSGLTLQLLRLYRGGMLQGEIWKIKNTCKRSVHVHPKEFYQKKTRAISILDESLNACDETVLYRIVDHA